jgi:pyridoxal phosphate enzyme (YggS family)
MRPDVAAAAPMTAASCRWTSANERVHTRRSRAIAAVTNPALAARVAARLAAVAERVRRAADLAGRDPATVTVLAVTKGQPLRAVEAALAAGLKDIGESRVQEAQAKRSALTAGDARWHMVGHLQRNKARAAAAIFDSVHSIDSVALAGALARHRSDAGSPVRVFIEVELTGLPGRTGVAPADAGPLLDAALDLAALDVAGLMTVAPPGSPDAAAACFGRLRVLRDQLRESRGTSLADLSMGMSDDFEVAVAHGATVIRLGRALFGERTDPQP